MGTITHMSTTYLKVTGVPVETKRALKAEADLKGWSLSEYLLDLILDGRVVQKRAAERRRTK